MNYSQLLKVPEWQKKRLEIFNRDGFKCTQCGNDREEIQIHHIEYFEGRMPWDYPGELLTTLCKTCHQKETNDRPKWEKYLLQSLKSKGFLAADILCMSVLIDKGSAFYLYLKEMVRRAQL